MAFQEQCFVCERGALIGSDVCRHRSLKQTEGKGKKDKPEKKKKKKDLMGN